MTYRQISYWPGFENAIPMLRWTLVTFLFLLFLLSYVFRARARHKARGVKEIILPGVCAILPFATILAPPHLYDLLELIPKPASDEVQRWLFSNRFYTTPLVGLSLMALGEAVTVWGMLYLGRNFSIATDVRNLVTSGPYRHIRHPLYCGEIISLWGYTTLWTSWWSLLGSLCFTTLQLVRARGEEKKLSQFFPAYEHYRRKTGMLFPSFVREIGPLKE